MKVIKYGHACMVLEKRNASVVIDPGNYTDDLVIPTDVQAILLTHSHADHVDPEKINAVIMINQQCDIFAHRDVLRLLQGVVDQTRLHEVEVGDLIEVGDFSVQFIGGHHAIIHKDIEQIANMGILVDNGAFFYPGDALVAPDGPIDALAMPASAPWMKIGEAIDFLMQVSPRLAFPVHDAILSDNGKELVDRLLGGAATRVGTQYQRISDGDSLNI